MTRLLRRLLLVCLLAVPIPALAQGNVVTLSTRTNTGTIPTSPGTGSVTLGGTQTSGFALDGAYGTVLFTVTGGWSGTITPEGQSCDAAGTWTALSVFPLGSTTGQSTITANGVYSAGAAGFCAVRGRGNTVSTAAATVTITVASVGGGGGSGDSGGGAVTIANGADVAEGNTGDAAWVSGAGTTIGLLKNIAAGIAGTGSVQGAVNVIPTDCSGTITSGGAAQSAIAANATLHGFTIANIDASAGSGEPLWISFTTTAAASTAASYPLSAPTATSFSGMSSYSTPFGFGTNHAVSIIGATTGHKFSCTYW